MCLAIPGRVVSIERQADATLRTATVDFGGVRKEISLAFTPEANPGDYVLVHVGFALSVIDEAEAQKVFAEFARLGKVQEELGEGPAADESEERG